MDKQRDQAGGIKVAVLLGHPERVHILAVAGQREVTPTEYAAEEGLTVEEVNYHFRQLLKADFLEVVREEMAGGATRAFYRARRQGVVADDEFKEMSLKKRRRLSLTTLRAMFRRAIASARTGRLDRRINSHLAWDAGDLDQRGFDDVMSGLLAMYLFFQQAKEEAAVRLQESGEEPIYTTLATMGFESPPERKPPGGLAARFRPQKDQR